MARKRMIDPEFWSDEEIGKWSFPARLFYIGLWNFADDDGRFKAADLLLKAQIFPYDKLINIGKLKKELNHKIQWYEVDNLQYGFIRNFLKHQRIERPTLSKLPIPPQLTDNSPTNRGDVAPNIIEVKLSKDKLIEDILSDLNSILNTNYKSTSLKTKEIIQARVNEGHTLSDFKTVHRKMAKAWGLDNKMRQYLRPLTLYSNKFESYLNRPEDIKELTPQQQSNLKGLALLNKELKNDNRSVQ